MEPTVIGRPGLEPITQEFLEAWQDGITRTAKKCLREDGRLEPYVFMLVLADLVQKRAEHYLIDLHDFARDGFRAKQTPLPKDKLVIVVMSQRMPPELQVETVRECILRSEVRHLVDPIISVGVKEGRTLAQTQQRFVEKAFDMYGLNEKDLLALHIRRQLKLHGALAYVKLDDGYMVGSLARREGETTRDVRRRYPDNLADCPEAFEVVWCTMEAPTFMRTVAVPYLREKRNTGRVTTFLRHEQMVAPRGGDESGWSISGRYTWLLEPPV